MSIVQQARPTPRHRPWLLLGLLVLAGWLRFFRIDHQELRGDEGFSWNYVTHEAGPAELVARIVREGDPQPPIHYWVLQGWVRVFGDSEFAMRSLSAFLSLLLVPLMYRFGWRLAANRQLGLLAAALTALHPYQMWLAQDVRNMYQLALIAGLIGTLQLPRLLRGHRRAWAIYVLCGALAMYSHYYALFGLLAHGAYIVWAAVSWRDKLRWVAGGVAIALAVLPWAIVILPVYAGGQLVDPVVYPITGYLAQTLSTAALGQAMPQTAGLWAAALLGLLGLLGTAWLWNSDRAWAALLLAWPLIALLGIYMVTRTRATFNTFYFLSAFPAVYMLVAAGLLALWARQRAAWAIAGALVLVGFALGLNNLYFNPVWSKTHGVRAAATRLQAEAQPGDVFIANFPDPAAVYYLRNLDIPYHTLPPGPDFDPAAVRASIAALAAEHPRLWHLPIRSAQWDANGFVETQLAADYINAASYQFDKVQLQQFVPQPHDLPTYHALNVTFDNHITLLGSYVTINGVPANTTPQPGDRLRVSLLWQSSAPVPQDYTVFVHALGPDGMLRAQHDGVPRDGSAPTSGWQAGNVILDIHEFQLPPESDPVSLSISIGMYDPETGVRLAIMAGGDSVVIWP